MEMGSHESRASALCKSECRSAASAPGGRDTALRAYNPHGGPTIRGVGGPWTPQEGGKAPCPPQGGAASDLKRSAGAWRHIP